MTNVNFSTALDDLQHDTQATLAWLMRGLDTLPILPASVDNTPKFYSLKLEQLQKLESTLKNCMLCPLHVGRSNVVFGSGNPLAKLFLVLDTPDADEDKVGISAQAESGELLDKMLHAIGFRREDIFLTNIVKCRAPKDRKPEPKEIDTCEEFLKAQIAIIQPQMILSMGEIAAQTLLRTDAQLSHVRGKWSTYSGIPMLATWDPQILLETQSLKREAWEDLKKVATKLIDPV